MTEEPAAVAQTGIDTVTLWADVRYAPLSIEKFSILHCSTKQQHRAYVVDGKPLRKVDNLIILQTWGNT